MRKINLTLFVLCATLLWVGAAQTQRYIDNGDGTITDTSTNLMREKKTGTVGYARSPGEYFAPGRHCPAEVR